MLSPVLVVLPLLALLVQAFAFRWHHPNLLPEGWTLQGWQEVFTPHSRVLEACLNSFSLALTSTLIGTLLAFPAARVLAVQDFRGKKMLEALLLAPLLLPPFVSLMGLQGVFIRMGLSDTFAGVVLAHLIPVTPYLVTLLLGGLRGVDLQVEQAARVLGAPPLTVFWQVSWPLLRPLLLSSMTLGFLVSWSDYLLTLIIGGGQVLTLPLLLFSSLSGGDKGTSAVLALVFMLPALVFIRRGTP